MQSWGRNDTQTGIPSFARRAQYAFKDSMIHWILQFTLHIAIRCVLHRCESQEIHCWKLFLIYCSTFHNNLWGVIKMHRQRLNSLSLCLQCVHRWIVMLRSAHAVRPAHPLYFNNDPSAGSPTETLLRLLLPLNDQVWSTSQQRSAVSGSPKPIRRPH